MPSSGYKTQHISEWAWKKTPSHSINDATCNPAYSSWRVNHSMPVIMHPNQFLLSCMLSSGLFPPQQEWHSQCSSETSVHSFSTYSSAGSEYPVDQSTIQIHNEKLKNGTAHCISSCCILLFTQWVTSHPLSLHTMPWLLLQSLWDILLLGLSDPNCHNRENYCSQRNGCCHHHERCFVVIRDIIDPSCGEKETID